MNLATLLRQKPDYSKSVCDLVRRSTGGTSVQKDVPVPIELDMGKLISYAKYTYLVQRPLNFDLATMDNLDNLDSWFTGLERTTNLLEG